jgi:hypothetical protein
MRRSSLLLGVALFAACAATPVSDVVVGPWLRLEHGNPAEVSELLAIELGHRAAVERDMPRASPRPEVDALGKAVRWCGTAPEVERAERVVRRLDVAREPDPRDGYRQVSTWFVWPGAKQATLAESIEDRFYERVNHVEEGCVLRPALRCTPDPAHDVMHVHGTVRWMRFLCVWMQDVH